MDYWFKTHPEDFFDNVGPLVASNFFSYLHRRFPLDEGNWVNSFRTSIQWSRLIKNLETGEPDPKGIAFYNAIIEEAKKNQMDLVMNLHHFDLPVELLQKIRWLGKQTCSGVIREVCQDCFNMLWR